MSDLYNGQGQHTAQPYALRPVCDDDIDAIAALEQSLFGVSAWSRDAVEQEIHAPARTYNVVTCQAGGNNPHDASGAHEEVIGYAGYWYDGDDAELMTIAVSSAYQGQGIASVLLRTLLDQAYEQGAYRMLLEVRVDNNPALALYRKFGFTIMGRRKRYYQPEGIDAFTMSMSLHTKRIGFQRQ